MAQMLLAGYLQQALGERDTHGYEGSFAELLLAKGASTKGRSMTKATWV